MKMSKKIGHYGGHYGEPYVIWGIEKVDGLTSRDFCNGINDFELEVVAFYILDEQDRVVLHGTEIYDFAFPAGVIFVVKEEQL